MAVNVISELNALGRELAKLFVDELTRQKLVDTGKLNKSIKFTAKKTSNGYNLQMTAEDYFEILNKKYNISKNVFKSAEYKEITSKIAKIYAKVLADELKSI